MPRLICSSSESSVISKTPAAIGLDPEVVERSDDVIELRLAEKAVTGKGAGIRLKVEAMRGKEEVMEGNTRALTADEADIRAILSIFSMGTSFDCKDYAFTLNTKMYFS